MPNMLDMLAARQGQIAAIGTFYSTGIPNDTDYADIKTLSAEAG